MKTTLLSLWTIGFAITLNAQNTIKPSYQYATNGNIELLQKVPGGIFLVGTSTGLTAIEAHSNDMLFNYSSLGKIKPEEMSVIPNTPYVILTRGFTKVILDYTTGKEVFNATKRGWNAVMSITPDFNNNTVVMLGMVQSIYTLGVFTLDAFESKGTVTFNDKKKMGAYINSTQYFESDGKFFVRTEKGIVCIDKQKLQIDWIYDDLDKTSYSINVLADAAKGDYYVAESNGKNHLLHKINTNGMRTTKKPFSVDGAVQKMKFINQGLLCQSFDLKNTNIQVYNRETGLPLWKKRFEIEGQVFLTELTTEGLVYASQKGFINTLDLATGKQILKKDIETAPDFKNVFLLENDNAFFLTGKNMGVANLKTGEYIKEPAKFKKVTNMITAYDKENDNLVVSTGTELYFIKTDGTSKKIIDITFKEEETPNKIEFRKSGILVGASQNNMLISYDGKVIYQSYYKAPGQSLAAKIAMGTLAAAAAGANQGMVNKGYKNDGSGAAGMENEMKKKFKATADTKDFLYILTKLDEGVGLIKLNKDNGEKVAEVILKDKKPEYQVDDDYGVLYYKKDNKLIIGYDLR
jgi:hypothetical protein